MTDPHMTDTGHKGSGKHSRLLHHLGVAVGLSGLILWFWAGRSLGFLDWMTALFPAQHAGAGLMVGIMLMMLPALLLYRQYNRWLESRLRITGRYYEDDFYRDDTSRNNDSDS